MKIFVSALALAIAVPAAAQTAPATNPHAGHAQHGQQQGTGGGHGGMAGHDHAKMMEECKKALAEGKCEQHCKAMMDKHSAPAKTAQPADGHAGHAH